MQRTDMLRKTTVLIVEDDPMVGEMVRGMLADRNYNVVGKALDGAQAISMTQSLMPDVIVMDIDMPDMDGIQATRRIQENTPTPVVILTAYEAPDLVERAGEMGAGAYLLKPPNPSEIDRAIILAMARFEDTMKLRQLNASLKEQNEALDAFAHMVAHDLKAPLVSIIGISDALDVYYDTMSEDDRKQKLRVVKKNGLKMNNIIDELLLLARIRKEKAVKLHCLNMTEIINDALDRLSYMIEEHQADITVADSWPEARGYAPWVEEIWVNYLSNAIKYGGKTPKICLDADELNGVIKFRVKDNGIGLTETEQSQIFEPFVRLEQVRVKGNGLGLSIVRQIVNRLGGSVSIESKPGTGSVFAFTLPASRN